MYFKYFGYTSWFFVVISERLLLVHQQFHYPNRNDCKHVYKELSRRKYGSHLGQICFEIDVVLKCPSSAVDNAHACHRCDPSERQWLYVIGYGGRPLRQRGLIFGYSRYFQHQGPLALTPVPTRDINISCRTCLSIVVK